MRVVVICEPVRAPVGRFGGIFKRLQAHEIVSQLLAGLLEKSGLDGKNVDDVSLEQCYPAMDTPSAGRVVGLNLGLPNNVGGISLGRPLAAAGGG